jgi:hypothetical protein
MTHLQYVPFWIFFRLFFFFLSDDDPCIGESETVPHTCKFVSHPIALAPPTFSTAFRVTLGKEEAAGLSIFYVSFPVFVFVLLQ